MSVPAKLLGVGFAVVALLAVLAACSASAPAVVTPSYLTEEIPPCTPAEGSDRDPCDEDAGDMGAGGIGAGHPRELGDEPGQIGFIDGGTFFATPHFAIRGTFLPNTTRCTFGHPFREAKHSRGTLGAEGRLGHKCFIDVRANEYYIGSGPSELQVLILRYENPTDSESFRQRTEREFATWLEGGEYVVALGPSYDVSTEVWQMYGIFKVVRGADGTVKAHHPARDQWFAERPTDAQTYIDRLEIPLPTMASTIRARHNERVEAFGGRIGSAENLPMLVTNGNNLRAYYEAAGAYDEGVTPPEQPPPACGLAVPDQANNPGLMRDCETLLAVKDTLRGTGTLNWSVDVPMADWDGVRTRDTGRVTNIVLVDKGLTGIVPAELAELTGLEELRLSGNSLSGCIPPSLREVAVNDLDDLGLPDCAG